MKKLIALAVVATCGAALAVESANIVGYQAMETVTSDIAWRTIAFQTVGTSDATYKLSQINIGSEDFAWYNNDYIATIASNGAQDQYYTYDPDANDGKGGWFECDEFQTVDYESPADDVELAMNQAIFVLSANGASPTVAGAVLAGDSELYSVPGDLTYTGNFTPAPITLGDIVVGSEDFAWYNNDYIATIASNGAQDQYYTYDPDANDGEGGWFECDEFQTVDYESPADDVEIAPMVSFIFLTANGATLNIPSPIK